MERLIKIPLFTPASVSLRVPVTHYGEGTYTPTPAELAQLRAAAREWLGKLLDGKNRARRVTMTEPYITWPNVVAAIDAQMDAEANQTHEAAEKALEREMVDRSLQKFATKWIPGASRAAEERYDVRGIVLAWVADHVMRLREGAIGPLIEGTAYWPAVRYEERRAPSAAAFAVYDQINRGLADLQWPEFVEVTLCRVSTFRNAEASPGSDKPAWRAGPEFTAVVVEIRCPGSGVRVVAWKAE